MFNKFLSTLALSIVTIVSDAANNSPLARYNATTLSAWVILSVSFNCLATLLILYRLYRTRRRVRALISAKDLSVYLGVAAILIESALPLSIAGIVFAAVNFIPNQSVPVRVISTISNVLWFAANESFIVFYLYISMSSRPFLQALSPQMIIFRVTMGRSWSNRGSIDRVTRTKSLDLPDMTFNIDHFAKDPQKPSVHLDIEDVESVDHKATSNAMFVTTWTH